MIRWYSSSSHNDKRRHGQHLAGVRLGLLACLWGVLLMLASVAQAAPATQAGAGRTFTVNRTDDRNDGNCTASDCSLREAILAANKTAALDTIAFDLAPLDSTLVLSATLPVIEAPLLLDGSTQPGYRDAPVVTLSGGTLARQTDSLANQSGLVLAAADSTVRALRLIDFAGDAIVVQAADVTIVGCELGIAADGTQAAANLGSGIVVDNAANTRIGGSTPAERNVITAQRDWGIRVQGQQSAGTRIEGNFIGTPRNGLAPRIPAEALPGNASGGISIEDTRAIQIGGSTSGAGNVIAGNGNTGIAISRSTAAAIRIEGNMIGVGLNGQEVLGNAGAGIVIESSSEIVIGGTTTGAGNVIAGNDNTGIIARGNASDIQLLGNAIGTDRSGTIALANKGSGVLLDGVRNVLVGGTTPAARNVIAGNGSGGITIRGSSATRNLVQGNYIGIDATGSVAIGNGQDGIVLEAPGNQIGGAEPDARNVIAGNGGSGIVIQGTTATGNLVQGNYIGTAADGFVALGNRQDGILITNAPRNQIGGSSATAGNLISGNQRHGLFVQGTQAAGNLVQGNRIGSDSSGEVALSNGSSGIYLIGSDDIQIGGSDEGAANIIIGHRDSGVFNANSNAELVGNLVRGNSTALRVQGGQLLALGNRFESNPLVFELNSGELRAALNQITGYEQAVERIAGTFVGNYNWWGRSTGSSPQGLDLATWNRRLYAVPAAWQAAPQAVQLDSASLQGGSGTAVIVRYDRDAFDLPTEEPFSQLLCSDYYTFFTLDGGGLWQVSIPIDATPACADVLQQAKLFRVTNPLPCRSQLADPACWEAMPPENRPNIGVQASEQQLVMSGLQTSDLEAIAYAAGDIRQPVSLRQRLSLIILTLLALLAVGGLVWWFWRRQRNAPTQPATNGSDTAATPSSTTFHGSSSDPDSSGKTGNGDSGDGSGNGGGD